MVKISSTTAKAMARAVRLDRRTATLDPPDPFDPVDTGPPPERAAAGAGGPGSIAVEPVRGVVRARGFPRPGPGPGREVDRAPLAI